MLSRRSDGFVHSSQCQGKSATCWASPPLPPVPAPPKVPPLLPAPPEEPSLLFCIGFLVHTATAAAHRAVLPAGGHHSGTSTAPPSSCQSSQPAWVSLHVVSLLSTIAKRGNDVLQHALQWFCLHFCWRTPTSNMCTYQKRTWLPLYLS